MGAKTWPDIEQPKPVSPPPLVTVVNRECNPILRDALCSAFEDAMAERGRLPDVAFRVKGFSGRKFRTFLNNLMARVEDPRYLEIGLFRGASMCSAMYKNNLTAVGVDNWSEYGGREKLFFDNYEKFKHDGAKIKVVQQDFRTINYVDLGPFNILFYDGPHTEKDQYDGVYVPLPALDANSILIVDDWNWQRVRDGTYKALRDRGVRVDYSIELRTSFQDEHLPIHSGQTSEWHNGTFLAVISKQIERPSSGRVRQMS